MYYTGTLANFRTRAAHLQKSAVIPKRSEGPASNASALAVAFEFASLFAFDSVLDFVAATFRWAIPRSRCHSGIALTPQQALLEHQTAIEALPYILREGEKRALRFVSISELITTTGK
jgi:hypothetical protein